MTAPDRKNNGEMFFPLTWAECFVSLCSLKSLRKDQFTQDTKHSFLVITVLFFFFIYPVWEISEISASIQYNGCEGDLAGGADKIENCD